MPNYTPIQTEISERFGKPFWDVLREFAAKGYTAAETARALGLPGIQGVNYIGKQARRNPQKVQFAKGKACPTPGVLPRRQLEVASRFNKDFWVVIQELADQGLSKAEIVRRIGWTHKAGYQHFYQTLRRNPGKVVWPEKHSIVVAYYLATGEKFGDALHRMAEAGCSMTTAAHTIGYSSAWALRYAMEARGIEIEFPKCYKRRKTTR